MREKQDAVQRILGLSDSEADGLRRIVQEVRCGLFGLPGFGAKLTLGGECGCACSTLVLSLALLCAPTDVCQPPPSCLLQGGWKLAAEEQQETAFF